MELVEHFFRHEYGRLVATLCRRLGAGHLEAIEDGVQSALMTAVERWKITDPPDNPSAWLFRVALNNVTSELRRQTTRRRLLERNAPPSDDAPNEPTAYLAGEVPDALLPMLFVCCDEALPAESQLALALKTLCGFGTQEIARALFTSEANVYKRLARARARLRDAGDRTFRVSEQARRRPLVRHVLYLMFNEGHLSNRGAPLRDELCDEAIRLGTVLAEHPSGPDNSGPETYALLALMHLNRARRASRLDDAGGLLLLEEQDRSQWDRRDIATGLRWLARSATGEALSRYHVEAGIAAEHCLAPSFAATRWDRVADSYALLERLATAPLFRLSRALAVAECEGPRAGLAIIEGWTPPAWLSRSYMWSAALADLHQRAGDPAPAEQHYRAALARAPTPAIKALLARRKAGRG